MDPKIYNFVGVNNSYNCFALIFQFRGTVISPAFTVLPQSSSCVRLSFKDYYMLEFNFRSKQLVSIRGNLKYNLLICICEDRALRSETSLACMKREKVDQILAIVCNVTGQTTEYIVAAIYLACITCTSVFKTFRNLKY